MAEAGDVRRLALALPHVVEIDSDGFDLRVADQGFVWSYPERRPGRPRLIRTDIAVLYVGDDADYNQLYDAARYAEKWVERLPATDVSADAGQASEPRPPG
jgi:hypothetical protein